MLDSHAAEGLIMPKPTPLSTTTTPALTHSSSEKKLLRIKPDILKDTIENERAQLKLRGWSDARISIKLAGEKKRYRLEKSAIEVIKKLLAIERIQSFLSTRCIKEEDIKSVTQFIINNRDIIKIETLTNSVKNIETSLLRRNYSSEEERKKLVKDVVKLLSLEIYAEIKRELEPLQACNRRSEEEIKCEQASSKHSQKEKEKMLACKLSLLHSQLSAEQRLKKRLDRVAKKIHDLEKPAPSISPRFEEDSKQRPSKRDPLPQVLQVAPATKKRSTVKLSGSKQQRDDNDSSTAHTPFPKV